MVISQSKIFNHNLVYFLKYLNFLGIGPISSDALNLSASTELAVSASAEKVELSSFSNDTGVATSTGDLWYFLIEGKLSGLI